MRRLQNAKLIGVAALLALAPAATAAIPEAFFPSQFGLLVEYYEVDLAALPPMLRRYQQADDATGLLAEVRTLLEAGEAALTDSSYLTTSGVPARISSVRELIYPASYDHAQVPQELNGPIGAEAKFIAPTRPSAFDTRHVGQLLEFERVTAATGRPLTVKVSADLVGFGGFDLCGDGVSVTGQPRFNRRGGTASVILQPPGSELLGTFATVPAKPQRRVLAIVSCTTMAAASEAEMAEFKAHPPTPEEIIARHVVPLGADPFGNHDADAQDPEPQKQVHVVLEYIDVDAALARQFTRQLDSVCDATAIRQSLDAAIETGEANLLDACTASGLAGQRFRSQSVREVSYPAIYDEPGTDKKPPSRPRRRTARSVTGPVTGAVDFTEPYQPDAFTTRTVGLLLDIEPTISAHGLIGLNLRAVNDRSAGETRVGSGTDAQVHPLFESLELQSDVQIPDGTSVLLAMHSLESARAGEISTRAEQEAARGRRVLVFLTAKAKR